MDAVIGDRGVVEVGVEEVVDRAVDEVDDLDGGVDDPERLDGFGEGLPKELLVELGDDVLAAFGGVDSADEAAYVFVEPFEGRGFGGEVGVVECGDHRVHDHRHGVGLDELVVAEERFEHGTGDEVLGEHPDGVFVPDGVVQVVAERFGERRETLDCFGVLVGVGEQRPDSGLL